MRLAASERRPRPAAARRWCLVGAVVVCAMALVPPLARAQTRSVVVANPGGNPLREATPRFTITTGGFPANELPLKLRLQLALSSDFVAPLFADSTVTGSSVAIVVPRLLPPQSNVWWRVIVTNAQGTLLTSNATGPVRTSPWLTLLSPNNLNGSTVDTPRPTFSWSSPALHAPAAPWRYLIIVSRSADGVPVLTGTLTDTVYRPFDNLESNTSYRWAVSAVAGTGDSVRVISASSFVIASSNAPIATVLYQNFPNPFPNSRLNATCIWFDLRRQSDISLEILDLRGNHVAKILPGRGLGGTLPPGRYGRVFINSDNGCDDRLSWDGTDDSGRFVRPGVYLIKFTGDGVTEIRKALFRGR